MAEPPAGGAQLLEENNSVEFLEKTQEGEAKVSPALSSLSSRVSGVAGGWGKWLITSASSLVTEFAAETVEAKNDLKEFCTVIASDSAAWVRRQTTGDEYASSGGSSPENPPPSSTVCMQEEDDNAPLRAIATPGHTSKAASEAEAKAEKEQAKEKLQILPFWRTDPIVHRQFLLMVKDDATFLSDRKHAEKHKRHSSTSAFPSQEEKAEYLNDSDVASAFARFVPGKVEEQLFWKRLHSRVCLLRREEKQVSVHPKAQPCSSAVGEHTSESEERI
ncbi:hypothetical protein Esti_004770 [Eimeria stiedai]